MTALNYERMYHELEIVNEELQEQILALKELVGMTKPKPSFIRLTATESKLFNGLMVAQFLTKESILTLLYAERLGDEPMQKIIDVYVCKLRKKLRPYGVEIDTVWGRGYSIKQDMKDLITALEAPFQDAPRARVAYERLSPADKLAVIAAYRNGERTVDIAAAFNLGSGSGHVSAIVKAAGEPLRHPRTASGVPA